MVHSQEPLLSMPEYQPAATFSATTRQLCCAPYVDVAFGNEVIREVVESERKAVPPSFGFDLDPVVRHCLRARRLGIARYAIVTAILLAGLCLNPIATIAWLALCALIVAVGSSTLRELPRPVRVALGAGFVVLVLCALGFTVFQAVLATFTSALSGDSYGSPYSNTGSAVESDLQSLSAAGLGGLTLLAPVLLAAAMFTALFLTRRHAYGIITTELAEGAPATAPRSSNSRVEWRIATVAAMQRGNVCVHDVDPFAGAGWIEHLWSFAVALVPSGDGPANRRIHLDGGELNRRVERAILAMRDRDLSEGERIPNIFVVPYVAADGHRRYDDPLIDQRTRTPQPQASAATLAAIENCPQGGLRHYLRAVVPANGKAIRTPDGSPVLPAQNSGIGVTAFIHLALEGGMLYTEFVTTVMPEIRGDYRIVDNLRPERVQSRAAMDTLRLFVRDNLFGPGYLIRFGWDAIRLQARMSKSGRAADEFQYYDYGARFSVRELAAERPTVKFMQRLDASKYVALLDRAVTDAVVEFLDEHGVDTASFKAAVTNVTNDYSTKTFYGGQPVIGNNNRVTQQNRPSGPRSGESRA